MAEKRNKPELRFKGFDGKWERRELGNEVQVTMGQSPNGMNYTDNPNDYILVQGNADIKNGLVNPRVWTTQVTKTADSGDLIMSVRAPVGDVGKTDYDVVIGRGVAAIKGNEFIFQSLFRMNGLGYWKKYSSGSTFESINSNELKEANLYIPTPIEQSKIGTFFKHLDKLITLRQKKYDKLIKVKKSMLEKMFPRDDADVPEIRFTGFDGKWEKRKLEVISDVRDGTHDSPQYVLEGHPFVTSKNVKEGQINYDDIQYISNVNFEEINKRSKVDKNDILMGMIGTIGNIALVRENPDFAIKNVALIKNTKSIYYLYLYHYLQSPMTAKQLAEGMDGGTQKFMALNKIRNLSISVPESNEQYKVGDYLEHLDNLITLHQRELEKLKNIKKSCLEKMFV